MFQFHYTLTEDDYIKFNMNHALNTKAGKKTGLILKSLVPCIFVAMIVLSLSNGISHSSLITEIVIFTIVSILWVILYKKIILRNIKKSMRMMKKSGRLPYNINGTMTFDENLICDTAPTQETKTSYNLIEAIYTTNDAIYIYNSAVTAFILPYRFIENQATFNSFVDFLQAKTNKTIINIIH